MPATPQRRRTVRRLTIGAAVLAAAGIAAGALPAGADTGRTGDAARSGRTVDVQLLSFNDFHGNLEPPQGSSGTVEELQPDGSKKSVPAGGAEYLAQSLRTARKGHPTPSPPRPVTWSGPARCCPGCSTTSRPSRR